MLIIGRWDSLLQLDCYFKFHFTIKYNYFVSFVFYGCLFFRALKLKFDSHQNVKLLETYYIFYKPTVTDAFYYTMCLSGTRNTIYSTASPRFHWKYRKKLPCLQHPMLEKTPQSSIFWDWKKGPGDITRSVISPATRWGDIIFSQGFRSCGYC